jgi:hypothetical protein
MRGSLEYIFDLASKTQNWPRLLPHYREVRVLEQSENGCRKVVEMACVREGFPLPGVAFPVRWRSIQIDEPDSGRIIFKHIAGIASGMWVVWTLLEDPWGRGVRVTIAHDLIYPFAVLNGWFARELIGERFIHAIAGRTLKTIKAIAEKDKLH